MEKFVPYSKMSKKERRAMDAKRRGSWLGVKPYTRTEDSGRAYNRKRTNRETRKEVIEWA